MTPSTTSKTSFSNMSIGPLPSSCPYVMLLLLLLVVVVRRRRRARTSSSIHGGAATTILVIPLTAPIFVTISATISIP